MTWWHALTHPEGNVVAATIVLLGVMLTGTITLLVSWRNRKHERGKENRDRLFAPRAEAYVEARDLLTRDQQWARGTTRQARSKEAEAEIARVRSRVTIYGTPRVVVPFNKAISAHEKYHNTKAPADEEKMYRASIEFDEWASSDIQDLRIRSIEFIDPPAKSEKP